MRESFVVTKPQSFGSKLWTFESEYIFCSTSRSGGLIRMNAAEYFIEDCPVSAALPEGLPLPAVHVLRAAHLRRNREVPVQPLA